MSTNKEFKIQNGAGITGQVRVGDQLVIDADGTVVLPAVAAAIAASSSVTDLQVEDASIRNYVDASVAGNLTLTGLAVNGASLVSGSPVKVSGKESMWIPAGAMYPQTTNGCSDLQQVELTVNNPEIKCLDFVPSSPSYAQFTVALPKSWDEGTVTFETYFTVGGTNTGAVVWEICACGAGDGDAIDQAFGSAVTSPAKAHSGTSNDVNVTSESSAVTVAGASTDSQTCFRLGRATSSASDTQSSDAHLLGIKVFFTTNASNDA